MSAADLLPFQNWPVVIPLHWDHPEYAPGEGLRALDPEVVESALRASSPLAVLLLALLRLPHTDRDATATLRSAAEARALIRRLWGLSPREALTAAVTARPRDPAELAEIVNSAWRARDAERARQEAAQRDAERQRREAPLGRIREVNARVPTPTPPEQVTCSGPPNRNPDAHLIVVFGSAARRSLGQTAEAPRDVDVIFCGVPRAEAEARAVAWAAEHGLGDVPVEAHERRCADGTSPPAHVEIASIDDADSGAHVTLLDSGDVRLYRPVHDTVAADLRALRVRGALGARWYARLAIGPSPQEIAYFGDGLAALRTAWSKLSEEQQLLSAERYGEVMLRLLERDPSPEERQALAPGATSHDLLGLVWYAAREGCWHAEQLHGEIPAGWMGGVS